MSSDNRMSLTNVPKVLYENRYCNQEGFSILACGGLDKNKKRVNQVLEVKIPSFEVIEFPSMEKCHHVLRLATINFEIFGIVDNYIEYEKLGSSCTSVEIYSEINKTWKHHYLKFEERIFYCFCSFMRKLYLIGGYVGGYAKSKKKSLSSCYIYNVKSNERNKISDLNQARCLAACTIFEGKIVVTGGFSRSDSSQLKSVESYDHYEDKWTLLPDMNEERVNHAAVTMGNKLFIIGGGETSSCEIFDSSSRKFTFINSENKVSASEVYYFGAFCIGSNIVVFQHPYSKKSVVYIYNVNELNWSTVDLSYTKNYFVESCIKFYVQ